MDPGGGGRQRRPRMGRDRRHRPAGRGGGVGNRGGRGRGHERRRGERRGRGRGRGGARRRGSTKNYVFPVRGDQVVLLPIKTLNSPYVEGSLNWCGGMPSAIGGNREGAESALTTVAREAGEETHGAVTVTGLGDSILSATEGRNTYNFYETSLFSEGSATAPGEGGTVGPERRETTTQMLRLDLAKIANSRTPAEATEIILGEMRSQITTGLEIDASTTSDASRATVRREFENSQTVRALMALARAKARETEGDGEEGPS